MLREAKAPEQFGRTNEKNRFKLENDDEH